ncbi:MAG: 3'-5' exonuclease [Verrucomicrobiota bacterium]
MASWNIRPVHVIDFEGSPQSGVVEVGVVTLEEGEVSETYTRLCQPVGEIGAAEQRQHGIRAEACATERPFADEWTRFVAMRSSGPLCAHHAGVEQRFLKQVWPYPAAAKDFLSEDREVADWGPWLDTRVLYTRVYPQLKSHALGELLRVFQLQDALNTLANEHCPPSRKRYHCALYDALGSALLLKHLCRQEEFAAVDLPWLLRQSLPRTADVQAEQQGELFD